MRSVLLWWRRFYLGRNNYRICAAIVSNDPEAIRMVAPSVDLFEVRIDLIGSGWRELVKHIEKPWIACNRKAVEGGSWRGSESARIEEILKAVDLGGSIIDIELSTSGVEAVVREIKGRADCLLSYHNLEGTPPPEEMREIINNQMAAGADICKLITTARSFADNIATLQLIADFPETKMVSFAMGALGHISRVLCPLVGGYFTYASIETGAESAPGQVTVRELRKIYGVLRDAK
jgi:3-dehydroquinate dehydratase type I